MTNRHKFSFPARCAALLWIAAQAWMAAGAFGQTAAAGSSLFKANCAGCHGADGGGGERAPNIATRREIVALSDTDLKHIVRDGVAGAGMPAFAYLGENGIQAVVGYLRTLQGLSGAVSLPGDPLRGKTLFQEKGGCSKCHMVHGQGGFMAEDLSGFGRGRSVESVRAAIVNPDANSGPQDREVSVTTAGGLHWTGLIRAQDNFSIVLQTEDGAFHSLPADQIRRLDYSGHSFMPQDYAVKLSATEMNDLVSYLLETGAGGDPDVKSEGRK